MILKISGGRQVLSCAPPGCAPPAAGAARTFYLSLTSFLCM